MKQLTIDDAETVILVIHDEMRRSPEARYAHRLHGLLLVAQGMSALEVARLLGDGARTVARWVHQFEREGLSGLVEGERSGRPHRLDEAQRAVIGVALRTTPAEASLVGALWDGKMLSVFIERQWGISLGVRQCQRLFRQLGFRLRTPRPLLAKADPEAQKALKKTRRSDR
jgi:transposase